MGTSKTAKAMRCINLVAVILLSTIGAGQLHAAPVNVSSSGIFGGYTVQYTGTVSYDDATQKLTIALTNTGTTGFITDIYFSINDLNDNATAALDSQDLNPAPVGPPTVEHFQLQSPLEATNSFGEFEHGLTVGGAADNGIAANGGTGTFVLSIDANDLETLTSSAFTSALGTHPPGESDASFVVRYRGIGKEDNKDYSGAIGTVPVPNLEEPPSAPLPAPVWAGMTILGGIAVRRRLARKLSSQ